MIEREREKFCKREREYDTVRERVCIWKERESERSRKRMNVKEREDSKRKIEKTKWVDGRRNKITTGLLVENKI